MRRALILALLVAGCGRPNSGWLSHEIAMLRVDHIRLLYFQDRARAARLHEGFNEIDTMLDDIEDDLGAVQRAYEAGRRSARMEKQIADMTRVLRFTECIERSRNVKFSAENPMKPETLKGPDAVACAKETMKVPVDELLNDTKLGRRPN